MEVPRDAPETIEMVQVTEDNFVEDLEKFQELLEDSEKTPLPRMSQLYKIVCNG